MKEYKFNYDCYDAEVDFRVDDKVFTNEMAKATLGFFLWEYDNEADPVEEVLKKYALEVILVATANNCGANGVIEEFNHKEGFTKLDGSFGLKLIRVEKYEFDERKLEVKIINV